MIADPKSMTDLNREVVRILMRELGPAATMRFMGQFTAGAGDYTKERDALFEGMTLDQLVQKIREHEASLAPQKQRAPADE